MTKFRIGKASDNDYVIDDAQVSRYHALLSVEADDMMYIEDLNSTNGVYVNDMQVHRKQITADDKVVLGNSYLLPLGEVLYSSNDYSKEFEKLKDVYDNYVRKKVAIQSSNQFKVRLYQSLPFVFPVVLGASYSYFGKIDGIVYVIGLCVSIIAPIVGIFLGAWHSSKMPLKLQELSNQFKIDYTCPKCGVFLGETPWVSLQKRKQCSVPTCRANWVSK